MRTIKNLSPLKINSNFLVAFAVVLSTIFTSVVSYAQSVPEKVDVDINTNGGGSVWYGQPWVWAVGVAIFIVIIVAITRGSSKNA